MIVYITTQKATWRGHARVILTQRAQAALFSGRTGCSQAECRGSQVRTSRYSQHVCAKTGAVLR
jgi:hypothetical protein